jgi:transcription elongation factor Elf1
MTDRPPVTRFDCSNCGAHYHLVRVEAGAETTSREITCRSCGAPLQAREGRYILKYFLVDRPRIQARAGRRR